MHKVSKVSGLLNQRRKSPGNVLQMGIVAISKDLMFVEHGSVQHAGACWKCDYSLRYYTHVVPVSTSLEDAVEFAYSISIWPLVRLMPKHFGKGGEH